MVDKTLSAQVYDTGLNALNCCLPDDSIHLNLSLRKSHEVGWWIHISEKLCRLSDSAIHADSDVQTDLTDCFSNLDQDIISVIDSVSFSGRRGEYKLSCLIGDITVELLANDRSALNLLAFYEEFDRKIGQVSEGEK